MDKGAGGIQCAFVIVNTGTVEEYSAWGREIAQKIDRGEALEAEVTLTFEDPGDMFAVMTPARLELFRAAKVALPPAHAAPPLPLTLHPQLPHNACKCLTRRTTCSKPPA